MRIGGFLSSILVFLIAACANPTISNVKENMVAAIPDRPVLFVPRFEGNPNFVEESTDYFVAVLEGEADVEVLQASALRVEGYDVASGGNIASTELGLTKARENGADLLVLGKVTSHHTSAMLNGFSTVRIYDVSSGERVANYHFPSGLLVANSEHQCVMAAVKRSARAVGDLLE